MANWLTHARRRILVGSGARGGGVGVGGGGAGGGGGGRELASGDEEDSLVTGASLYASEPTKSKCDVCHSQWRLLGEFDKAMACQCGITG